MNKPTRNLFNLSSGALFGLAGLLIMLIPIGDAKAVAPCGDFDECKVLIEINSTDGDIGFHWLMDAEDLNATKLFGPHNNKLFENRSFGVLRDQKLTETFGESSEPVCRENLKEEEDDVVVTLEQFVERWAEGIYTVLGRADGGEKLFGETELTHDLPAAPKMLAYDNGVISWTPGNDLGECADFDELSTLVNTGVLPTHPVNVDVTLWEVVLEVELEDDTTRTFSVRLPGDYAPLSVTVPIEFINSIPEDTLAKIEVGAVGVDSNATFSELGDLCINENEGCEEEED